VPDGLARRRALGSGDRLDGGQAESPRVWDGPARSLAAAAPGDDDLEGSFPGQEGRRRR